jgi:hypothetical protein
MGVDPFVLTGGIRGVTGGVRVGFWGLYKQFIAAVWALTGVICRFGTSSPDYS